MSKLLSQIMRHEGIRLKPYKCTAGKTTIGYGRNLDDKGITLYEAEILLEHDIMSIKYYLEKELDFWFNLGHVRQDAVINMAYNMGVAGLMGFEKTLAMISMGEYSEAAIEMLDSKWARGKCKKRALELSHQMGSGEYK